MKTVLEKIAGQLMIGQKEAVVKLTSEALDSGVAAVDIVDHGLLAGMEVVGNRFKAGDMFIPEVLRCAQCMHAAMDLLQPLLSEGDASGTGTFVIGTVEGDQHDIGKNLVAMMLEAAGFKVIDLGINLKPEVFVEAVKEHQPDIMGMSALLTTTMPKMAETIKALEEAGIRDQVKIMAGGAPVTEEFTKEIGADAYGANAAAAADIAKALCG